MTLETSGPKLERVLGLPLVTLYGVGVTVGAGIYVLVGEVAAVAGYATPVAFLLAAIVAGMSALSYSELAVRLPQAGGEAAYAESAFSRGWLTLAVGLAVAFAGITSSGAIVIGFGGYFLALFGVSGPVVPILAVLLLGLIAFWGVRQSFMLIAVTTLIEIGGIALVIGAGAGALGELPAKLPAIWPDWTVDAWRAVIGASVLAFFAFIGFEDIVNMAEETRDTSRVLPRAILLTLVITTVFYLTLTTVAVLAVPLDDLSGTGAPLALIFERGGGDPRLLSAIAMLAVINGALIQIIMASRLLYGMARLGRLPSWLARVNARTHTPDAAIVLVTGIVLASALLLPIDRLAGLASLGVLSVFAIVNAALIRVRLRRDPSPSAYRVPLWVPVAGLAASAGLLFFGIFDMLF